jgi:heterodisulfide reductase subunit B
MEEKIMKYLYYPGCSLKSSGKLYEDSLLAVFKVLGVEVQELEDWNCCGATNYMSISEDHAIAITARNLALAEMQGGGELIAPCAACYMGLLKTQNYLATDPEIKEKVCKKLTESGLQCEIKVKVRHPLDVLVNDVGLDAIRKAVKVPLNGVKAACYYGCQLIRPFAVFDNAHDPQTMDKITRALGAEPVDWPIKTRCCSGSMTNTLTHIGLSMNFELLKEAKLRGANVMLTACPLCQFNLECFQGKINRKFHEDVSLPVMYFTQFMGLALGIPSKELGLNKMLSPELILA